MPNYITKAEVQALMKGINDKLDEIYLRLFGRESAEKIKLADLDDEVLAILDSTRFYKIGTRIREVDLPTNVATKSYVDGKTRGIVSASTAPGIIDEIVDARDGEVSLLDNLANYSEITDLITNINALLSGTIDKERLEPHDHNTLTNRDASDVHPLASITDLSTELGLKSYIDEIIGNINANTATRVDSVTITAPGTGYTAGALVVENAGTGGTGFAGTYTVTSPGGAIDVITITNKGTGYITAPIITPQPGGSSAVLDADMGPELISLDKIDPIDHSDLTGTSGSDCHPTSSITGLDSILNGLSGTLNAITIATTGPGKYADVGAWISCWNDALALLIASTGITIPCFVDLTP
jgi:hypothetical protein